MSVSFSPCLWLQDQTQQANQMAESHWNMMSADSTSSMMRVVHCIVGALGSIPVVNLITMLVERIFTSCFTAGDCSSQPLPNRVHVAQPLAQEVIAYTQNLKLVQPQDFTDAQICPLSEWPARGISTLQDLRALGLFAVRDFLAPIDVNAIKAAQTPQEFQDLYYNSMEDIMQRLEALDGVFTPVCTNFKQVMRPTQISDSTVSSYQEFGTLLTQQESAKNNIVELAKKPKQNAKAICTEIIALVDVLLPWGENRHLSLKKYMQQFTQIKAACEMTPPNPATHVNSLQKTYDQLQTFINKILLAWVADRLRRIEALESWLQEISKCDMNYQQGILQRYFNQPGLTEFWQSQPPGTSVSTLQQNGHDIFHLAPVVAQ